MVIESKNIFYVSNFNTIGGVETYIYELAKKYNEYDITVIYRTGSIDQVRRIKKYVRTIKYHEGDIIKCNKAFFNYETDIIHSVEAKEYTQLIHALFKTNGLIPRIEPKITKYLCVSKKAGKEWEELTGITPTVCRNPLSLTEADKEDVLYLVSATRLTREKGKDRMIRLAEELDKAGINYLWLVFTNDTDAIDNPNVIYVKPRLNVRPYIKSIVGKGFGVQLSDCEGDCYFTRECEAVGLPLIVTPIASFEEQGLVEGKNCYYVPFDMVDVKVERFKNILSYDPYIGADSWIDMLDKTKSTYKEELNMEYLVEALQTYEDYNVTDSGLGYVPKAGETFKVNKERLDVLLGENDNNRVYVKVLEEIKDDEVTEEVVQAVANAIVDEADEQGKTVDTIVKEIVEESKPKKKATKKKGGK